MQPSAPTGHEDDEDVGRTGLPCSELQLLSDKLKRGRDPSDVSGGLLSYTAKKRRSVDNFIDGAADADAKASSDMMTLFLLMDDRAAKREESRIERQEKYDREREVQEARREEMHLFLTSNLHPRANETFIGQACLELTADFPIVPRARAVVSAAGRLHAVVLSDNESKQPFNKRFTLVRQSGPFLVNTYRWPLHRGLWYSTERSFKSLFCFGKHTGKRRGWDAKELLKGLVFHCSSVVVKHHGQNRVLVRDTWRSPATAGTGEDRILRGKHMQQVVKCIGSQ
ncbi:hypothetical protein DYB30_012750 [Aphanomyces astaci]|uniref:Uncharacterized protein n=1 Tax=Aphanomyces astaci TaxID=112090 RepID=A0A397DBJ9_APHAT|nr:hypothetical protein DYB30_012750 [Aphanomyces astaci]